MTTLLEYSKINTIWQRDERGRIIHGTYSTPEFEYLADNEWTWTEKVDGTNIRIGRNEDGSILLGGRTANAQIPAKLIESLQRLVSPEMFRYVFGDSDATLYGEGYGAGIQSGGNYSSEQTFVLFDVRIGDWWLRRPDLEDVAEKLGLRLVPVVLVGTLTQASDTVAGGIESEWGAFPAEGLVGRPGVELFSRKGERILAKIKARDFAQKAMAE